MSLHSLKRITDPECAFLPDHNPFNILGLNPRETDFPDDQALRAAYDRAAAHARSLATSSTLSLPSLLQVELAYSWLISDFRAPALAFWRSLHRSTWNPHAHVGSVEAGLPIPGQSGPSHDEAETLMWAAVDAMTAKPYDDGFALQSSYMDGLADGSEGGSDGDDGSLFCVVLGTFRCSTEKDERANVVVGMLDRRGRYYRRILDFWMKDEPLPERKWNDRSPGWGSSFAFSCPHGSIDYLTRFRNRTELEVMALVRQELAWLQADVADTRRPWGQRMLPRGLCTLHAGSAVAGVSTPSDRPLESVTGSRAAGSERRGGVCCGWRQAGRIGNWTGHG